MKQEILSKYGNQVRIRVCGLCWQNEELLMVNHHMYKNKNFWAPPGGGVDLWERMENALKKEFLQETGLVITVNHFRFAVEFIKHPLHAIEIFFDVNIKEGSLIRGTDPEMSAENQIIVKTEFLSMERINAIPETEKHGIFTFCKDSSDLRTMSGIYRI